MNGSPTSWQRDVMPSVSDGLVFWTPALVDEQVGVIGAPLSSRVTPETCQSRTIGLMNALFVNDGMS